MADMMIVEVTNHFNEKAKSFYVRGIRERTVCGDKRFTLLLRSGGLSQEYREPLYTYRILEGGEKNNG